MYAFPGPSCTQTPINRLNEGALDVDSVLFVEIDVHDHDETVPRSQGSGLLAGEGCIASRDVQGVGHRQRDSVAPGPRDSSPRSAKRSVRQQGGVQPSAGGNLDMNQRIYEIICSMTMISCGMRDSAESNC